MVPIERALSAEQATSACETVTQTSGLRAFRIPEVCQRSGLGRTSIFAAIRSGHLVARKWGRRTIVLQEDLANFLRNLPKAG